jgi:uncharacterized membrane protein (UPF0127 family)
MKIVELRTEDGRFIARARMAHSFRARWIGLIGEPALGAQEGLLLVPGGSIHTFGMRFAIDAVFLDRQLRVIGLRQGIPPWRVALAPAGTRLVLELRAGRVAEAGLERNLPLYACFDDEESEEMVPRLRSRVPDSAVQPRPSSPCISFSLRLPPESSVRGLRLRG